MSKREISFDPGSSCTASLSNTGQTAQNVSTDPICKPLDAGRPTFKTEVGFALWDIYSGRYPDRLVPHADAAHIARLKVSTFTSMRSRKAGPPFVRLFGSPYYDLVDLIHWIEDKMEFNRA